MAVALPLLILGGWLQPGESAAASLQTCSSFVSGCHFQVAILDGTARNVPAGQFVGTHARHAGYSAAKRQYGFVCTKCHPSAGYTNSHQSGFKNITGSSLPGTSYGAGKKIANTNSPSFAGCSQIYCHSNGRGLQSGSTLLQYSSSRWGSTQTCLACHGGRTSALGTYARSKGGFTLSTTHSHHLKYSATYVNCNICHSKTAADAATLKSYTGVTRHNNGKRDVTFTNIAYGSYTSYKSIEAGSSATTRYCNNVACHGGRTRTAWSATATNNNNTCVHCHGVDGTATSVLNSGYSRRFFAPGWKGAVVGTSTDQVIISGDVKVGAHFKHLSSVYMKSIKCNECHKVPSNPFDAGHMDQQRYNSPTLVFNQASTAKWDGANSITLSAFGGYTASANNVKAATCSSVYCHGNRMPRGDTSGSYRKPYWNYSAMINYTDTTNSCGRCHGNPPTAGTTATTHSGKTPTTSCSGCHGLTVDATGKIINKVLHINGVVDAQTTCTGCHSTREGSGATQRMIIVGGVAGAEGDDFIRASHHVNNGSTTSIVTNFDCILCHAEGDITSTTGSIKTVASLHGGDSGPKTVMLRNVDAPASYWAWPGKRLATFTATTADRDNMDSFCMGCHDSNGASGVNVNATNSGLNAASTRALTPFNTADTLNGNNGDPAILKTFKTTTYARIVDVKSQFNSTNQTGSNWASHHNLNQFTKRYTTRNTTSWPNAAFTTAVTRESANLQTTGETTGLHCSDCHLNEANAHGAKSRFLLQSNTGTDVAWSGSAVNGTGTHVCWKCHAATVYSTTGTSGVSHHDHTIDSSRTMTTMTSPMGIICFTCHGGYSSGAQGGLGAIHGNNESYNPASGAVASKRYRFMSGGNWKWYKPAATATAYVDPTSWTTGTAAGCYTESVTTGVWSTACTQHSGGQDTTLNAPAKALSW